MTMKKCSVCQKEKPATDFYVRRSTGKPLAQCKPCNIMSVQKYQSSKQGRRTIRTWNESLIGRASKCASAKKWANDPKNHNKVLAGRKRWRESENGKEFWAREDAQAILKKCRKRWRKTPRGKTMHLAQEARRRARKHGADATLTATEWTEIRATAKGRCYYCRKKVAKLTRDHVIPLSKGGQHTRLNIVAACQSCNSKKHDKILTLF